MYFVCSLNLLLSFKSVVKVLDIFLNFFILFSNFKILKHKKPYIKFLLCVINMQGSIFLINLIDGPYNT